MKKTILNHEYIEDEITTNQGEDFRYRWSHGATDKHMGDGMILYSMMYFFKPKISVCLGSGNTAITNSQTSAGNVTLTIALSTSGDPGTGRSDNSGTGFISFPKNDLNFQSGTLRYRIKAVAASSGDGTGSSIISFTNNGVTNSDMDITLNFS